MSKPVVALVLLLIATPLAAQIQYRPTDPPLVTAANEAWYQLREPIQFAGELYYPAGPAVFFDGRVMVRTGHYNGVPLYTDATIEPYSVVLVPISRGMVQPYERLRRGDLAGTTGSRTPSFPVRAVPDQRLTFPAEMPTSPTGVPLVSGAIGSYTPDRPIIEPLAAPAIPTASAPAMQPLPAPPSFGSLVKPENNDGVWVRFMGRKWVSAGAAMPMRASEFRRVGEYAGFPVFIRQGEDDMIYLPTRAGLVAPYRLKDPGDVPTPAR